MKNRQSLTLYCYQQLHNTILSGKLLPGTKLKIHELKTTYGVGATPVREALSRLTATGLVEAIENCGFRVTCLPESQLRDLMDTHIAIEVLAFTESIKRGDDLWEGEVVGTLHRLERLKKNQDLFDHTIWSRYTALFHKALVSGCGSQALMHIRNSLDQQIECYRQLFYLLVLRQPQELDVNHDEHILLTKFALKRDVLSATHLLKEHLTNNSTMIIEQLQNAKML